MRGTAHCMSKATVAPNAFVLDFKFLNKVQPLPSRQLVRCGPGAQWCDLIVALNPYAQSPRTMQSYSNFSVGGSLGCNAHGITTDLCCAESVHSVDVVLASGELVTGCRRDAPEGSLERRLFRSGGTSCVGGGGGFGLLRLFVCCSEGLWVVLPFRQHVVVALVG
jgi:FAD/FMN-containing dehydrogenase